VLCWCRRPLLCCTRAEAWRNLKRDDVVDCADSLHKWYSAKVLDVKETVDAAGNAQKQVYISFDGWSALYNEWYSCNSVLYVHFRGVRIRCCLCCRDVG
jgi:hypothetical protein